MTLAAFALRAAVVDKAHALGFARVAFGPATPPEHGAAFDRWLAAGYAGGMTYLARGRDDRLDPGRLLPGVQSVVALALHYGSATDDGASWAPVARYARGRDYHDVMRPRLEAIASVIREAAGARTRVAVDTSAVLERDLAARAGLGWIGKNTNLLAPALGSYFFIGIVLTTAEIPAHDPAADHCGTCTACLDACPTQAFVAPYVLDARRCLAYLTIEHRGDIDEEFHPALADHVFGCDVCQEVCPWNRRVRAQRDADLAPREEFPALAALLDLDEAAYRQRFRDTAMWRATWRGIRRNAALSLSARQQTRAKE